MSVKKVLTSLFAAALVTATVMAQENPASGTSSAQSGSTKKEEQKSSSGEQAAQTDEKKLAAKGNWELTIKTPDGETIPVSLDLQQEGETVTGTTTSPVLPAPAKVEDGKAVGDQLTFSVMVPDDSGAYKATITGTITGDTMQGKVDARGNVMDFTGARKKAAEAEAAPAGDKDKKENSPQKPLK